MIYRSAIRHGIVLSERRHTMNGHTLTTPKKIKESKDVLALVRAKRIKQHVLVAIHMSRRLAMKFMQMVPDGDGCGSFDTSKIVRQSIVRDSEAIILTHTHPDEATISPNKEDIKLTKILIKVGRLTGAQVVDHIILGKGSYYSFKEHGRLFKKGRNYKFTGKRPVFKLVCGR